MNQNKRFVNIDKDIMLDGEVWCTAGGEHCADIIATTLNTLFEENKELAKEVEEQSNRKWACIETARLLDIEKEALTKENDMLKKENNELNGVIKEVYELLSEEVDLFSDKATEHDINAYLELKELDNKDAYYMATATKKAIKMLKELLK